AAIPFAELIRRVRAGDAAAAAALVRQYEPAIRSFVRVRLVGTELQRLVDSVDISQSVLSSFFVAAALGRDDLAPPEKLLNLLLTMARNKFVDATRKRQVEWHEAAGGKVRVDEGQLAAPDTNPLHLASLHELFDKFRALLSEDERRLADLRGQEHSW